MIMSLLRVENLRTYFDTRSGVMKAVDGITLDVREGSTLGIVGKSGSGKSVTALSIMRLIERPGRILPGSHIYFEGKDLAAIPERELEKVRGNRMSMVFQEPMTSLNPVHTVGDQIIEAIRLHRRMSARQARERAIELLELVGIPSPERRVDAFPHQMSGGMRQRVMIAMALACEPKLLIADEPTTALDVTIQAQILELLRQLRDRLAMAVILITHDLGVVAEMCDDVAVMYAGQVVERGSVEAVFRSPQHPYTEALLRSIPLLGMTKAEPLNVIPGMVPSALQWPVGCRFAARCSYASDHCHREPPALFATRLGIRSLLAPGRYGGAIRAGSNRRCMSRCCTPVASRNTSRSVAGCSGVTWRMRGRLTVSIWMSAGERRSAWSGESGSGKSTLGRILVGLMKPSAGELSFDGTQIAELEGAELRRFRRELQFIFQDPSGSLDPRMKVRDIVGEGLDAQGTGARRA